jgi:hypothetical protein
MLREQLTPSDGPSVASFAFLFFYLFLRERQKPGGGMFLAAVPMDKCPTGFAAGTCK